MLWSFNEAAILMKFESKVGDDSLFFCVEDLAVAKSILAASHASATTLASNVQATIGEEKLKLIGGTDTDYGSWYEDFSKFRTKRSRSLSFVYSSFHVLHHFIHGLKKTIEAYASHGVWEGTPQGGEAVRGVGSSSSKKRKSVQMNFIDENDDVEVLEVGNDDDDCEDDPFDVDNANDDAFYAV
ncbi:hypothetical protein QVD17_11979 [Tagetes erecta]|uniref:Uncharacterized protein n=1 Tax=Tagetes erecta TaxID=13708 RepID=A0AAD8KZ03_TARER|nr:hypothetical protein QVD17_11979 [Tagetes erecta]